MALERSLKLFKETGALLRRPTPHEVVEYVLVLYGLSTQVAIAKLEGRDSSSAQKELERFLAERHPWETGSYRTAVDQMASQYVAGLEQRLREDGKLPSGNVSSSSR